MNRTERATRNIENAMRLLERAKEQTENYELNVQIRKLLGGPLKEALKISRNSERSSLDGFVGKTGITYTR